jgi:hypothetical protein
LRRRIAAADDREVGDERNRERCGIERGVAAGAVAAIVFDALRVSRCAACTGARIQDSRLQSDQVLQAADVAFRHVEVIVAGLVGNEVLPVHCAAEELEGIVEAGERLEVIERGAAANRGECERV